MRIDSQLQLSDHFPLPISRRPLRGVIPPCTLTIDDRRAVVRPHAPTDTVADLAEALGCEPTTGLWIDGVPVAPDLTLLAAGIRVGSAVNSTPPSGQRPDVAAALVELAVVAGPSCRPWRPLPIGRHLIGRSSSCDLVLDDPAVELHHGIIDVAADGALTFTQLTGRVPARLDGSPCGPVQAILPNQSLLVGASLVVLRVLTEPTRATGSTGSVVACDRDPWRRVVRRGPAPPDHEPSPPIAVPAAVVEDRAASVGGLVGAAVAACGAVLMGVVLGQAMFAVFALLGAVASFATWAVGALGARRRRRRSTATRRREVDAFLADLDVLHAAADRAHREDHAGVAATLGADERRFWERRVGEDEPLRVTIGRGTWRRPAPISIEDRRTLPPELSVAVEACERLTDVAVPLTLGPGTIVALHGELDCATALARSIVVQLATWYGPADWRLVVETDRPDEWDWSTWLPHRAQADARIVVVTDKPAALAARTGPLRRFLDATGASALVITPAEESVPSICAQVLELGATGLGGWRNQEALGDGGVHVAGISRATARDAARGLSPLVDPEDHDAGAAGLPYSLSLSELSPDRDRTASAIAHRWAAAGADPTPLATIGWSADGTVDVDLVRDGPHGLLAGTTGSGKSELLRTLVVALAAEVSPDHLSFVLVDFKGGATFDTCDRLPHVVGVVTDLEHGLAERALVSLDAEIRRRERLLRDVHADDLHSYRRLAAEPLARLVVVIDEFATLAKELPDFLTALVGIAQRGRSLGIHLLLATQRPSGVVTDDIRANTNLRLALRLQDRSDAIDVVGDDRPAGFARDVPGRAALRLGPDDLVVFQTASTAGPVACRPDRLVVEPWSPAGAAPGTPETEGPTELTALVDAICEAARMLGLATPHRPWLDPLPPVLDFSGLDCAGLDCAGLDSIGLVDDPAAQAQRPLRWDRRGNLLLVGALGSGTTTTAVTVAAACVRGDDEVELYVIDGRGEPALDALEALAACAGVIRVGEAERLDRLMCRLLHTIDQRALGGARHPTVLVLIDGLGTVRAAAPTVDRVFTEGPAVGVVCCATTDGTSAVALTATNAERWVFHVDEPAIARASGLRAESPPAIAGRLCLVESGLTAQVARHPDPLLGLPRRGDGIGVPLIEVLAEMVDPEELNALWCREPRSDEVILIGLAADDLGPAGLHLPVGDHIFIGGAARTGKSTALRQIAAAWRDLHPQGLVVDTLDTLDTLDTFDSVGGGRTEDPEAPPILVVVDDADRVDDRDGVLAAIIAGRRPGVTIAAAARLEAARVGYGHWAREVTRSRCGLIMTAAGEVDGELLGATLPRRSVIAARPGLAWVIDGRGHRLVQVAARMPP